MQPSAWPLVKRWIDQAANDVTALEPDPDGGARVLETLELTERSVLGALATRTGGLAIDHGWLRVLGGALLLEWHDRLEDGLIVGHDAAGGFYAVGRRDGEVCYLVPGSYEWMGTEMSHSAWVHWTLMGDLEEFYDGMREPGWEAKTAKLGPDKGLAGPMAKLWAGRHKHLQPLTGS